MRRFYLHLASAEGWTRDEEGIELPDVAAAEAAALADVRALIAADVVAGNPVLMLSFVTVEDETGRELARVNFRDAASFV